MDAELLRGLSAKDNAETWMRVLAGAGVPSAGPGGELYALAQKLWNVEDALRDTRMRDQMAWALPDRWWLWLPLTYFVIFFIAAQWTVYIDRLIVFGTLLCTVGLAAVLMLARLLWIPQSRARARTKERPHLLTQRTQLRESLVTGRDDLLSQELAGSD